MSPLPDTCLVNIDARPVLLRDPPNDEWWRGLTIYQIYVRSFQDSGDDGIGDLPGVLARLDYIAELGIDAVWLSPFYASPQKDFGYDVSDFRMIEPSLGTFEDFERLIEAFHARGIKVLLDFVPAHTSEEHAWFRESRSSRDNPKADWYIWADAAPDGTAPNNWISSFGGPAWTWDPRRAQFYFHTFLSCQPALNLQNPEVLEATMEELDFWLKQGVDGVRIDAAQSITCDADLRANPRVSHKGSPIVLSGGPANPFARQLHLFDRDVPEALAIFEAMRARVERYDPPKLLLGELSDVDSPVVCEKYTGGRKGLHITYDFDFINASPRVDRWLPLLLRQRDILHHGWNLNVFSNHDAVRVLSNLGRWAIDLGHQDDMAKLLMVLQLTLRGGVSLYQGQELGLTEADIPREEIVDPWGLHLWPDFKGRDGCRTPLPWERAAPQAGFTHARKPWLPIPTEHRAHAVDVQEADESSVLNFTRRFLKWRKTQPALIVGDVRFFDVPAPLVVFERFDHRTSLVLALNFSAEPRSLSRNIPMRPLDTPDLKGTVTSDGIMLPPFGAFIGEQAGAEAQPT